VVDRADAVAAGGECRAEGGPVVDGLEADEFAAEPAGFVDADAAVDRHTNALASRLDDLPAVRRDDLGAGVNVLAELLVDGVGFDPGGDRALARGVGDTSGVLTALPPVVGRQVVLVVGTGTPPLAPVCNGLSVTLYLHL
jgi:hypothetical protein